MVDVELSAKNSKSLNRVLRCVTPSNPETVLLYTTYIGEVLQLTKKRKLWKQTLIFQN